MILDALVAVATRLSDPKDVVRLGTLSRGLLDRLLQLPAAWSVVATPRARDAGMDRWLAKWPSPIASITYKRSVFSPLFGLPALPSLTSLSFWCCRVHPAAFRTFPPTLNNLAIHQMAPGDDPGCLTPLLNTLPSLRSVSITLSSAWGTAAIGPLCFPHVTRLDIRMPDGHLVVNGAVPPTTRSLTLHARSLDVDSSVPFPPSLIDVDIRCPDTCLDAQTHIIHPLKSLRLECSGIVFPPNVARLESFRCRCDSFYIGAALPEDLQYIDIDVRQCFVCEVVSPTSMSHVARIPNRRFTQRGKRIDLMRYMNQEE